MKKWMGILLAISMIVLLVVRRPKAAPVEEEVEEFIPTARRKAAEAPKKEMPKKEAAKKESSKDTAQFAEEAKTVAKMEQDIAKSLAKEAEAAVEEMKEEDDDFEFIDLELKE